MICRLFIALLVLGVVFAEKDYTDLVKDLKDKIENNPKFHHSAYNRLANIVDSYGTRLWGSQTLEMVINEMRRQAEADGFDNIRLEPVTNFTKWVRGKEELILHSPRPFPTKLNLIGLGRAAPGHLTADAIVVRDFDELEKRKDEVKDKIVVYNEQWTTYYDAVVYRATGAERAKKYGAAAILVRSVASFSIYSVHAGMQSQTSKNLLPAAAITVEDAEMLQRMQDRGQRISLELTLENYEVEGSSSNNLVFEIQGATKPDEVLLMGGHIDSWDTGSQTGANDDGGGFITCYEAMRLLKQNGYRPQRTIRFIAWSGEEWGDPKNGNQAYLKAHLNELDKHIVAFEDDLGSTKLLGFGYQGDPEGKKVVQMIADKYLGIINAQEVSDNGEAVDTKPLFDKGVPTMINLIKDNSSHDFYFQYHHTAGDSMTVMDADDLDSNVLGVAAMFFILADLDSTIPRGNAFKHIKQQHLTSA